MRSSRFLRASSPPRGVVVPSAIGPPHIDPPRQGLEREMSSRTEVLRAPRRLITQGARRPSDGTPRSGAARSLARPAALLVFERLVHERHRLRTRHLVVEARKHV